MTRMHDLGDYAPLQFLKNETVDRVELGTLLSEDLKWTEHVNKVTSSCFGVFAVLRRITNVTPQETKKLLVQSLVLSKLNFNYTVTYPLPVLLQKRMQRVQNAADGFVLNRYILHRNRGFKIRLATYTRKHSTLKLAGHFATHTQARGGGVVEPPPPKIF